MFSIKEIDNFNDIKNKPMYTWFPAQMGCCIHIKAPRAPPLAPVTDHHLSALRWLAGNYDRLCLNLYIKKNQRKSISTANFSAGGGVNLHNLYVT